MQRIRVTEYLDLDLTDESWYCHVCSQSFGSARDNYKHGLLVYARDPREVHQPLIDGPYTFAPDPEWVQILEFYCPQCGTQVETEYLPHGHPLTHDITIDLDMLQQRIASGELSIKENRLVYHRG
jgi:acetophenone carboxylase